MDLELIGHIGSSVALLTDYYRKPYFCFVGAATYTLGRDLPDIFKAF